MIYFVYTDECMVDTPYVPQSRHRLYLFSQRTHAEVLYIDGFKISNVVAFLGLVWTGQHAENT